MKVLNRGYIIVSPKSIFFNELTPQSNIDYLVSEEPEPSVYLIEEDFWDDETVLKKYYKRIVHSEMSQLETKDANSATSNAPGVLHCFTIAEATSSSGEIM